MALAVNLQGMDADGVHLWHFAPRLWDASAIRAQFGARLEPAEPWPSWEGFLTVGEVVNLRERYGQSQFLGLRGGALDLDALLKPPTAHVRLRIEEWGYG